MSAARTNGRPHWTSDERLFLFAVGADEAGEPVLERLKRREFPSWAIGHPLNVLMGRGVVRDFRCFLTGMALHMTAPGLLHGRPKSFLPWTISKDHLVARYGAGGPKVHGLGNIVPMGWHLNAHLGHRPLAAKLHLRQGLHEIKADRETPTSGAAQTFLDAMVALDRRLLFRGRLPYQPWTYEDPGEREAAERFLTAMDVVERRFLDLDFRAQADFAARPPEVDLEELHHRLFGGPDGIPPLPGRPPGHPSRHRLWAAMRSAEPPPVSKAGE